ncbi:MAG TPA: GGDEF domain-containing protein [Candidatus Limnocylindrales bacterium]|nr:GGDEF domain-containing protein [Candidatus Limnocylindrales bacterium]
MSETTGAGTGSLTVLSAGAAALARAEDLDQALGVIVEAGASAVGAPMAAVFVQDGDDGALELLMSLGMDPDGIEAFAAEVTSSPEHPIHRAALDRTGTLSRTGETPDGTTMTGADLPLVVASGGVEACVGVLTFGWEGVHEVGTGEETLLVAIADLAAAAIAAFRSSSLAIERAEWAERVSHTDPLTGLSNARTLSRVLELEVARAQRQASEVSVALFDIDGFGALNEAAGARAADRALREVAAVLAETVRLVDTVARTGADEFVLVAPGSAGVLVAKRVLDGIAKLAPVEGTQVTVSAGVARFPQDGTDAASLLEAARAALASSSGTSQVAEAGA